jgi:hypothetical protein
MKKYNIIIKTGEAEIRAIEHLPIEATSNMFPIIELTRGRKITRSNTASYPFDKRLEKIKDVFEGQDVCIDVTSDPALSSPETHALYNPKNGYENWVRFLLGLKAENKFGNIVPTILWNFDDPNFEDNIKVQITSLTKEFGMLAYRNPIEEDAGFYEDIETFIKDMSLLFIVDCEYVPMASCQNVAQRCIARINNLKSLLTNSETKFILAATSYPNNVTEFGEMEKDELMLSEICLYNAVKAAHSDVLYGDYGSIFPKRNDAIVMARGWVPKIDVSLPQSVFYHRQRRPKGVTAYADTYIQVAKSCVEDPLFPQDINDIWGIRQIRSCAMGSVPSSSPSFWISVRMNVHVMQRLRSNLI